MFSGHRISGSNITLKHKEKERGRVDQEAKLANGTSHIKRVLVFALSISAFSLRLH